MAENIRVQPRLRGPLFIPERRIGRNGVSTFANGCTPGALKRAPMKLRNLPKSSRLKSENHDSETEEDGAQATASLREQRMKHLELSIRKWTVEAGLKAFDRLKADPKRWLWEVYTLDEWVEATEYNIHMDELGTVRW